MFLINSQHLLMVYMLINNNLKLYYNLLQRGSMAAGPTQGLPNRTLGFDTTVQIPDQGDQTKAERRKSVTAAFARTISRTFNKSEINVKPDRLESSSATIQAQAARIDKLKNSISVFKQTTAAETAFIKSQISFADKYQKMKFDSALKQNNEKVSSIKSSFKTTEKEVKKSFETLEARVNKLNENSTEQEIRELEASFTHTKESIESGLADVRRPIGSKFSVFVTQCISAGTVPDKAKKAISKQPNLLNQFYTELSKSSDPKAFDIKLLNTFGEKALAKAIQESLTKNQFMSQVSAAFAKEKTIPHELLQNLDSTTRNEMKDSLAQEMGYLVKTTGELPQRPAHGLNLEYQDIFGRVFKNVLNSSNAVIGNVGGGSGGIKKVGVQIDGEVKWLYVMKAGSFEFKDKTTEVDRKNKEAAGFKDNQEDMRELVSNVGFFGMRNMAVVQVPSSKLQEGKEGLSRVVIMDYAVSSGTLQELTQTRSLDVQKRFLDALPITHNLKDFHNFEFPNGVNSEALQHILGEEVSSSDNLKNIRLMKFIGKTLSDNLETFNEHKGTSKIFDDPNRLKEELDKLTTTGKSEMGQEILNFVGELLANPQNLAQESTLTSPLLSIMVKVAEQREPSIGEKVFTLYNNDPKTKETDQKSTNLGLNPDVPSLHAQSPTFLQSINILSLAKCVFHAVANRGDDTNAGNVLLKKGNGVEFSSIDDGETHSPNKKTEVGIPFWSGVVRLNRPLGATPEEVAYKNSILNLDIDKEVKTFTDTLDQHNEKHEDYAPEMYRARLQWIKAGVTHNLSIADIGEFHYVSVLNDRVYTLIERNNNLPEGKRLSPEKLNKQIEREATLMAKVCADATQFSDDDRRLNLFTFLTNTLDENPNISSNELKKLTDAETIRLANKENVRTSTIK